MLAILLGLTTQARAEKVDWGPYLDKNPSAPMKVTPTPAPKTKAAPASPAPKVAAPPKVKPKARAKTRPRH